MKRHPILLLPLIASFLLPAACMQGTESGTETGIQGAVAQVRRLGPPGRPVSVKWSLEDSTALRDSDFLAKGTAATDSLDFLPASGTLGFESGVSELRVPVRIVDDTLEEAGETNPTGLIKSTDRPWR